MPKITLTADEEIQYLRELDRIQEIMPDLEVQVVSEPVTFPGRFIQIDNTIGDEFRTFLKTNHLKVSLAEVGHN